MPKAAKRWKSLHRQGIPLSFFSLNDVEADATRGDVLCRPDKQRGTTIYLQQYMMGPLRTGGPARNLCHHRYRGGQATRESTIHRSLFGGTPTRLFMQSVMNICVYIRRAWQWSYQPFWLWLSWIAIEVLEVKMSSLSAFEAFSITCRIDSISYHSFFVSELLVVAWSEFEFRSAIYIKNQPYWSFVFLFLKRNRDGAYSLPEAFKNVQATLKSFPPQPRQGTHLRHLSSL